ncbi:hypothetical protein FPQ18DRAFT_306469 [Pyronema domesticum]|nr:hypothetical protein FPQ18DRAFT_306469 [Pyronema domesticum]
MSQQQSGYINTSEAKENTRTIKIAHKNDNQAPVTPTDDPALDMPGHTPFNSPGMHRLAKNRPAPSRRPFEEMSDIEKETERKNAHFFKRLANARQQLENRDKDLDEIERLTRSIAMGRLAKRDAARKEHFERKKATAAKPAPELNNAHVNSMAPPQTFHRPISNKKKDILHLKTSSGKKVAKFSSGGWTAINHRKIISGVVTEITSARKQPVPSPPLTRTMPPWTPRPKSYFTLKETVAGPAQASSEPPGNDQKNDAL